LGGGDFGGRLVGQFELEAAKEKRQFGLRLGVAGELQFAAVGGGDVAERSFERRRTSRTDCAG